jgi:ribosomal protein L22
MVSAQTDLRASEKAAHVVCKKINRRRFAEAKDFAEKLAKGEADIDGKLYDKAADGIMRLLRGLESNAKNRNMEPAGMRLNISVHNGPKLLRGRRNRNFGMRLKIAKVQAVLMPMPAKKSTTRKSASAEPPKPSVSKEK